MATTQTKTKQKTIEYQMIYFVSKKTEICNRKNLIKRCNENIVYKLYTFF